MITNDKTRKIKIGNITIGGGSNIAVQSMLNIPAHDINGNAAQAKQLEKAGCEIVRVSVPDAESVKTLEAIKKAVTIPVVADIHFDWRMAIESVYAGADKIRINPGNIGDEEKVKAVVKACREKGVPIRIGVNSGSLQKEILEKYQSPTAKALYESGKLHIELLERYDFYDIVLSLKASDTKTMYDAYSLAAEDCPYPLHLGVTEAGTKEMGIIKSCAAIGGLLLKGVGDTIRISLTDDPVNEVLAANKLLKGIGLKKSGINLISCPTCGRTAINLIAIANEVEKRLENVDKNLTVAVMGCVVNGPGEAKNADIGIAGGKGSGVLFKRGEILYKNIPEEKLVDTLIKEIEMM